MSTPTLKLNNSEFQKIKYRVQFVSNFNDYFIIIEQSASLQCLRRGIDLLIK